MKPEDIRKAFEKAKTKKISMNVNEKYLEMIDELARIHDMDRTKIIEALIPAGIKFQTEFSEKTWKKFLEDKEYSDKKELIKNKLKEIEQFKKKWAIDKSLDI
ncbi:hypothetical protein J4233_01465 [Candidatus Pacearchaeota archaeon]|nr:hypothetical protein [Candidatus Pacearchaeota archaeon]